MLETSTWSLYQDVDKPLLKTILAMEKTGVYVNTRTLSHVGEQLDTKIKTSESAIFEHADTKFNIASPQQLSEILFENLKLTPPAKKGKNGFYSTRNEVLEKLDHPIREPLLAHRMLSKLKNTYTDSLKDHVEPKTGRIHAHFLSTQTATGRLACQNPNLQIFLCAHPKGVSFGKLFRLHLAIIYLN